VKELRGAIGTVAMPPPGVSDQQAADIYWIEFAEPWPGDDHQHRIDSAEVDASFLMPARG
jgi:hypothetical protein